MARLPLPESSLSPFTVAIAYIIKNINRALIAVVIIFIANIVFLLLRQLFQPLIENIVVVAIIATSLFLNKILPIHLLGTDGKDKYKSCA